MLIPKTVVDKMKEQEERLGAEFSRVWGLLPMCPERDNIMLHLLQAKTQLHDYIEGVDVDNG